MDNQHEIPTTGDSEAGEHTAVGLIFYTKITEKSNFIEIENSFKIPHYKKCFNERTLINSDIRLQP